MFLDLILDRLWRRRSADQAAWVGIQKPPKNGKVVFWKKNWGNKNLYVYFHGFRPNSRPRVVGIGHVLKSMSPKICVNPWNWAGNSLSYRFKEWVYENPSPKKTWIGRLALALFVDFSHQPRLLEFWDHLRPTFAASSSAFSFSMALLGRSKLWAAENRRFLRGYPIYIHYKDWTMDDS